MTKVAATIDDTPDGRVHITDHAVRRFLERTHLNNRNSAVRSLRHLVENMEPHPVDPGWRKMKERIHNQPALYRRCNGWILVLVDEPGHKTCVTCYLED